MYMVILGNYKGNMIQQQKQKKNSMGFDLSAIQSCFQQKTLMDFENGVIVKIYKS